MLVRQNIKLLRGDFTKKEITSIDGGRKNKGIITINKNEMRRKGLFFICKGCWGAKHSCPGDRKEETRIKQGGDSF